MLSTQNTTNRISTSHHISWSISIYFAKSGQRYGSKTSKITADLGKKLVERPISIEVKPSDTSENWRESKHHPRLLFSRKFPCKG